MNTRPSDTACLKTLQPQVPSLFEDCDLKGYDQIDSIGKLGDLFIIKRGPDRLPQISVRGGGHIYDIAAGKLGVYLTTHRPNRTACSVRKKFPSAEIHQMGDSELIMMVPYADREQAIQRIRKLAGFKRVEKTADTRSAEAARLAILHQNRIRKREPSSDAYARPSIIQSSFFEPATGPREEVMSTAIDQEVGIDGAAQVSRSLPVGACGTRKDDTRNPFLESEGLAATDRR